MKSIIIVADKKLKKYGRALVHAISKTKKIKVVLYTPNQYESNEAKITGSQYVIFLGKNKISKDFIPLIKDRYKKFGAVWGYDYSKAVIYSDDSMPYTKKQVTGELKKIIKNKDFSKNKNLIKKYGMSIIVGTFYTILFGPLAFIPGFFLMKFYSNYDVEKLQIELGIVTFLNDGLNDFIEGNK